MQDVGKIESSMKEKNPKILVDQLNVSTVHTCSKNSQPHPGLG